MTNTPTYSNPIDSIHPLGLSELLPEEHYTPRYLNDRTTHLLDNVARGILRIHDAAIDNAALVMLSGIVAGMLTMGVAIAFGLRG